MLSGMSQVPLRTDWHDSRRLDYLGVYGADLSQLSVDYMCFCTCFTCEGRVFLEPDCCAIHRERSCFDYANFPKIIKRIHTRAVEKQQLQGPFLLTHRRTTSAQGLQKYSLVGWLTGQGWARLGWVGLGWMGAGWLAGWLVGWLSGWPIVVHSGCCSCTISNLASACR